MSNRLSNERFSKLYKKMLKRYGRMINIGWYNKLGFNHVDVIDDAVVSFLGTHPISTHHKFSDEHLENMLKKWINYAKMNSWMEKTSKMRHSNTVIPISDILSDDHTMDTIFSNYFSEVDLELNEFRELVGSYEVLPLKVEGYTLDAIGKKLNYSHNTARLKGLEEVKQLKKVYGVR